MRNITDYANTAQETMRKAIMRSLKNPLDKKTGEKIQVAESLMPRPQTPQDTQNIIGEMSPEYEAHRRIVDMQKELADISPDQIEEYQIRPGDTISDVLERTGMTMGEFLALNAGTTAMSEEGELYSGDTLSIVQKDIEDEDTIV